MNTTTTTPIQVTLVYRYMNESVETIAGSYDSMTSLAQEIDNFIGTTNIISITFHN